MESISYEFCSIPNRLARIVLATAENRPAKREVNCVKNSDDVKNPIKSIFILPYERNRQIGQDFVALWVRTREISIFAHSCKLYGLPKPCQMSSFVQWAVLVMSVTMGVVGVLAGIGRVTIENQQSFTVAEQISLDGRCRRGFHMNQ